MKDFCVVSAKTLLRITSVSPIRGFLPPSIIVLGDRLDHTKEVLFNGIEAKEFIIASPSRLIVRIPQSQVGKELRSIKALSTVSLAQASSELVLEVARPVHVVEGVDRLVQSWLLVFMTNPGSDIFHPQSGGGGRAIVGRITDRRHKSVAADLALAIERTKSELLSSQARGRNLPLNERLLSSDLESLSFDEATGVLSASVSIKNMLGDQAEVALR